MPSDKIWTVIDLIHWGQQFLKAKQIESPRLNIELMLCDIIGCKRIDLYLKFDYPLSKNQLQTLREYVQRRVKNEPLQYIFGKTEFFNLTLKTDKRALIPRPETELLVGEAINELKSLNKVNPKLVEIGTGSGCIAISIAKNYPDASIIATDISSEALDLAKENSNLHSVENIKFIKHNFLKEKFAVSNYDLIISNPPYIPKLLMNKLEQDILNYEPLNALTDGADGLIFYKRFSEIIEEAKNNLILILEIDGRNTDKVVELFDKNKYSLKVKKDFANIDRILIVKKLLN
jgi:release factor glutamine methyltransferase